ncbi:type II toxin-antitoxin system TacA family antitoxin [Zavarzinella formosa]|uniref:type II toxin-antitoxin system TacA family antitoxin n=1 Tax=Zavarzinella formosa TaxID=360055 RepID=UPI0002DD4632|nr:DUF1778 domain-containing protein [Zavarzinella formosa]
MADNQEQFPIVISIQTEERQRALIDLAADRRGRSREGFILEAACREAEDILLDQVFFPLDHQAFARFHSMLDNPPLPTDGLRRLLLTKAPWE